MRANVTLAFNCQISVMTYSHQKKTRSRLLRCALYRFAIPSAQLVEMIGIEPTTSGLQSPRSPN